MKHFTTLSLIFIFLLSCQKIDVKPRHLLGVWELRGTAFPTEVAINNVDFPKGNGTKLVFSKKTFKYFQKDSLANEGTYSLKNLEVCGGNFELFLIFEKKNTKEFNPRDSRISISKNQLNLTLGCPELDVGGFVNYEKID